MLDRFNRLGAIQDKINLLQQSRADYIKTERSPEDEDDKAYLQYAIEQCTKEINECKMLLYRHIARAYLNNQL